MQLRANAISAGYAALLLVCGSYAAAEEMSRVYDIRCEPKVDYFSLAPIWATPPESLLVPIVPEPTNGGPTLQWNKQQFEPLRQRGLLFAELHEASSCRIGDRDIQVSISESYDLVVKIDDQVVFNAPTKWSTDDSGLISNPYERRRTYELVRLEFNYEIWRIQAEAVDREPGSTKYVMPNYVGALVGIASLPQVPILKALDENFVRLKKTP